MVAQARRAEENRMIIIGIDPGKTGAIACFTPYQIATCIPMPDPQGIAACLVNFRGLTAHAFLEKAQARPGQGVSSMFNYGTGYGTILGILAALEIPHTLVTPQSWMKVMHAGTAIGKTKDRSIEAAKRLFPGVSLRATAKSLKDNHGMAEALLIAAYGQRVLSGQEMKAGA